MGMIRLPLELDRPQSARRRPRVPEKEGLLKAAAGAFVVVLVILVWVLFFSVLEN